MHHQPSFASNRPSLVISPMNPGTSTSVLLLDECQTSTNLPQPPPKPQRVEECSLCQRRCMEQPPLLAWGLRRNPLAGESSQPMLKEENSCYSNWVPTCVELAPSSFFILSGFIRPGSGGRRRGPQSAGGTGAPSCASPRPAGGDAAAVPCNHPACRGTASFLPFLPGGITCASFMVSLGWMSAPLPKRKLDAVSVLQQRLFATLPVVKNDCTNH